MKKKAPVKLRRKTQLTEQDVRKAINLQMEKVRPEIRKYDERRARSIARAMCMFVR